MSAGAYGPMLDALRGLTWPARLVPRSVTAGTHPSRLRGATAEFTEYRAYRQGDDPRRIDWKLLARTDRAFLRITQERATHATLFVLDASASMDFPDGPISKWQHACQLVVGLASVALAAGDPVGWLVAGVPHLGRAPRARRDTLADLIRTLDRVTPDVDAPLAPLLAGSVRASRIVIVSDLLGDGDAVRRAAGVQRARGTDISVLHVVAPEERNPPSAARLAEDPEQPTLRATLHDTTRVAYRSAFAAWRAEQARAWRALGATYREVSSDAPAARDIRAFIARRVEDAA
ncbi:MAG: DUF58 domain-containing protein [Gemmatimonadaceae bacterium]|jgi:uncharacterized protein (DUF58 family)|nr:DUF58 domain-containing protein [Gemmatimonadaceae bacterium]